MADVFYDFVYTRNTSAIGSTDTSIIVEDVSLFPSNLILAKGEFYCVIESALAYPNSFEIVKLTSVNTSTKTLNVVRAQAGTTAQAHAIATYIKGSLTSDMLRRVRAGGYGTVLPAIDSDVYLPGDRFYHTSEKRYYAFTGAPGRQHLLPATPVPAGSTDGKSSFLSVTGTMDVKVLTYDFSSGSIPASFDMTNALGSAGIVSDAPSGYTASLYSGSHGNNSDSYIELTATTPAENFTYWRRVEGENGPDYMTFTIDGVEQEKITGTNAWTQVSFPVSAGQHTFRWAFHTDVSVISGISGFEITGIGQVGGVSGLTPIAVDGNNEAMALAAVGSQDISYSVTLNMPNQAGVTARLLVGATTDYANGYLITIDPYSSGSNIAIRTRQAGMDSSTTLATGTVTGATQGTTIPITITLNGQKVTAVVAGTTVVGTDSAIQNWGQNIGLGAKGTNATSASLSYQEVIVTPSGTIVGGWRPAADIAGQFGAFQNGGLVTLERVQNAQTQQLDDILEALQFNDARDQRSEGVDAVMATQVDEMLDVLRIDDLSTQRAAQILMALTTQVDDLLGAMLNPEYTVRVSHGDYAAANGDWVQADQATGTVHVAPTAGASEWASTYNVPNLTTTGGSSALVVMRGVWSQTTGSCSIDGASATQIGTNTLYGSMQMWAWGSTVTPGSHTIAVTPTSTGAGVSGEGVLEVVNANLSSAQYFPANGGSLTVAASSPGIVMMMAQVNGGTPPSISSAGGLTWTSIGSGTSGSTNAFNTWWATVPVAGSYAVTVSGASATQAVFFPGGGVFGNGTYTQVILPGAVLSGDVLVTNTDTSKRIAVVGPGLDGGNALMPGKTARYVCDGSSWRSVVPMTDQIVSVSADYQAGTFDQVIVANGTLTVTLPAASKLRGKVMTVKNSGTGTVTVATAAGNIDGSTTVSLSTQYAVGRYVSDGTSWWNA